MGLLLRCLLEGLCLFSFDPCWHVLQFQSLCTRLFRAVFLQSSSVCKNSMLKRGTADSKRKRWHAIKALETKTFLLSPSSCVSSVLRYVHPFISIQILIFVTHILVQDAAQVPDDTPPIEVLIAPPTLRTSPHPLTPPSHPHAGSGVGLTRPPQYSASAHWAPLQIRRLR